MFAAFRNEQHVVGVTVAGLALGSLALRIAQTRGWGLTHFDEGIYALAATWVTSPRGLAGLTPQLIPYAPPLFVILSGVGNLILGVGTSAPVGVSLLAATATIPLVYRLGRRVMGADGGLAAAALVALSAPHVAFSGMGLVDSLALATWCSALLVGAAFLERPGALRAFCLGLAVGVAQLTKYSGFLSGVIVAISACAGLWVSSERPRSRAALLWGILAAGTAALVYFPWFQFVEQHGGYGDLLRHQRGYTSGPGAWLEQWRLQLAQQTALSGRLVVAGLSWGAPAAGLAWILGSGMIRIGGSVSTDPLSPQRLREALAWVGWLTLLVLGFGCWPMAEWWVALLVAPLWWFDRDPARRLIAWGWLLMSAITPLYHPYARLWLPVHAASWLITGAVFACGGRGAPAGTTHGAESFPVWSRRARLFLLSGLLLAGAERVFLTVGSHPLPGLFSGRQEFASPASVLGQSTAEHYSLLRPPDRFYLALSGTQVRLRELASLDALPPSAPPGTSLLVDSAQLVDPAGNLARLEQAGWVILEKQGYLPALPTRLDQNPGEALGQPPKTYQILRFEKQATR